MGKIKPVPKDVLRAFGFKKRGMIYQNHHLGMIYSPQDHTMKAFADNLRDAICHKMYEGLNWSSARPRLRD